MNTLLQSQKQAAQPGLAKLARGESGYASASIRGSFQDGAKTFAFAGMARVSNAARGAYAIATNATPMPSPVSSTRHVAGGVGTQVDNVGFMLRTGCNQQGEPVVTIYPYVINPKKPGSFFDPKLSTIVQSMVREVEVNGTHLFVNGALSKVAPREIVGFTSVLDFSGQRPAQWAQTTGTVPSLRDVSFAFQR